MPTERNLLLRMIWLALLAIVLIFLLEFAHFYFMPMSCTQRCEFEIQPGQSLHQAATELEQSGIIAHRRFFILMAKLTNTTHRFKAGEYRIRPGQTEYELMHDLISGNVILRTITIVPGWRFERVLSEFHENAYLKHDLKALTNEQIRDKLGVKFEHLDGVFWAETYSFAKNTEESQILIKAYREMMEQLTHAWNKRDLGLMYTAPYEALIVSSLVEKETAIDEERAIIAGVILRRVQKNMYLQIDPTVIYALGDRYDGRLTHNDLKYPSPYNTYVNKGLPPTPIAIPSLASIQAAMHPDQSGVLYFVSNGNGRHIFSTTLEEHNQTINKLRAGRERQKADSKE